MVNKFTLLCGLLVTLLSMNSVVGSTFSNDDIRLLAQEDEFLLDAQTATTDSDTDEIPDLDTFTVAFGTECSSAIKFASTGEDDTAFIFIDDSRSYQIAIMHEGDGSIKDFVTGPSSANVERVSNVSNGLISMTSQQNYGTINVFDSSAQPVQGLMISGISFSIKYVYGIGMSEGNVVAFGTNAMYTFDPKEESSLATFYTSTQSGYLNINNIVEIGDMQFGLVGGVYSSQTQAEFMETPTSAIFAEIDLSDLTNPKWTSVYSVPVATAKFLSIAYGGNGMYGITGVSNAAKAETYKFFFAIYQDGTMTTWQTDSTLWTISSYGSGDGLLITNYDQLMYWKNSDGPEWTQTVVSNSSFEFQLADAYLTSDDKIMLLGCASEVDGNSSYTQVMKLTSQGELSDNNNLNAYYTAASSFTLTSSTMDMGENVAVEFTVGPSAASSFEGRFSMTAVTKVPTTSFNNNLLVPSISSSVTQLFTTNFTKFTTTLPKGFFVNNETPSQKLDIEAVSSQVTYDNETRLLSVDLYSTSSVFEAILLARIPNTGVELATSIYVESQSNPTTGSYIGYGSVEQSSSPASTGMSVNSVSNMIVWQVWDNSVDVGVMFQGSATPIWSTSFSLDTNSSSHVALNPYNPFAAVIVGSSSLTYFKMAGQSYTVSETAWVSSTTCDSVVFSTNKASIYCLNSSQIIMLDAKTGTPSAAFSLSLPASSLTAVQGAFFTTANDDLIVAFVKSGASEFYVVSIESDLSKVNWSQEVDAGSSASISNLKMYQDVANSQYVFAFVTSSSNVAYVTLSDTGSLDTSFSLGVDDAVAGFFNASTSDYAAVGEKTITGRSSNSDSTTMGEYSLNTFSMKFESVVGLTSGEIVALASSDFSGTKASLNVGDKQPLVLLVVDSTGQMSNSSSGTPIEYSSKTGPTPGDISGLKVSSQSSSTSISSTDAPSTKPATTSTTTLSLTFTKNLNGQVVPTSSHDTFSAKNMEMNDFYKQVPASTFGLSDFTDCVTSLDGAPGWLDAAQGELQCSQIPNKTINTYKFTMEQLCYSFWEAEAPIKLKVISNVTITGGGDSGNRMEVPTLLTLVVVFISMIFAM